jgi:hypothetical protein
MCHTGSLSNNTVSFLCAQGSLNREVRDNLYNQQSSRGHSIFQVTLRKNFISPVISSPNASTNTNAKSPVSPEKHDPNSKEKDKTTSSTNDPNGTKTVTMKSRLSRLFFVDLA